MKEAEFLKSWPSLAPAVWRLVNAALKERGDVTQGSELSQAEKAAAEAEISIWLSAGDACDNGFHVQRAMDAAVAESDTKLRAVISATGLTESENSTLGMVTSVCDLAVDRCKEVARLTKELAEELEKHAFEMKFHDEAMRLLETDLATARRRVERERDEAKRGERISHESHKNCVAAFAAERDALQKQNAELVADVERWKNFNDHPAFVAEIARLKARNAELVKERDELARKLPVISQRIAVVVEAAFREGYMARAGTTPLECADLPWSISRSKEALNQTPE